MLILISNDDGVRARGIQVLARTIRKWAEVVVVAPEHEQNAASHSLTLHRPLRIRRIGRNHFSVNGTPTDCITLAVHQILSRRPDLILSGINRGANLGDDIHYSGTVSAAVEGAILGIPAVAVSLTVFHDRRHYYGTAAHFTVALCQKLVRSPFPKGTLLNVNVPNLPEKELAGWEVTSLGKRNYGGVIVEKTDPRGEPYYWIGGDEAAFFERVGTDCTAIQRNKISLTPLKIDMTHEAFRRRMRQWTIG